MKFRSKLITLFFVLRLCMDLNIKYWWKLKTLNSIQLSCLMQHPYLISSYRATTCMKRNSIQSVSFFLCFHDQVTLDQYEAVRQWCRESQNRFQKLRRRRIKDNRFLWSVVFFWSHVVILRFFFWICSSYFRFADVLFHIIWSPSNIQRFRYNRTVS